jgi:hypothetical protein
VNVTSVRIAATGKVMTAGVMKDPERANAWQSGQSSGLFLSIGVLCDACLAEAAVVCSDAE